MYAFVPLAAEVADEGTPGWVFGAVALAILVGLLTITLVYGSGRPHT
jgi:hypothetical protein